MLILAAISANPAPSDRLLLSRKTIDAGLRTARCELAPADARIIGTEWLGRRLRIVEVSCSRATDNAGSILFAVPVNRPRRGRLIRMEDWRDGRVVRGYAVTSPGYDRGTRTLNSVHKDRGIGDCGIIKEWKWTGWFFRLMHVWKKSECDGEPFDWERRHKWRVFPRPSRPVAG